MCVSAIQRRARISQYNFLIHCGLILLSFHSIGKCEDNIGLDGQVGHIAFPTFGREESITHLELMPFSTGDYHALFGDMRAFVTNDANFGVNLGAGARFIEPAGLAMFGISGWYDGDQSTGELFHQLGLNLEARTEFGGLTANVYWPIGNSAQELSKTISNQRFEGNEILFDLKNLYGDSMSGTDILASVYIPGKFAEDHNLEFSAGGYFFQGDNAEDITGWKMALNGLVTESVAGELSFTNDDTFGANTSLGIAWRFGAEATPGRSLKKQLRRYVDRNYNVIVSTRSEMETGVTAINPATGLAYEVQHVSNTSIASDGSVNDPWQSISDAQAAGGDIIFVHSGTSLTESVTLSDGQILIGEGASYSIATEGYGTISLPRATVGTDLPTIINSPGDTFTMASGSTLAGFNISSANGNAIVADGIDDFHISDIIIDGTTGDGIYVNGSTAGEISRVSILNAGGNGLHIVDIDDILNLEDIEVENVADNGVLVHGGLGEINFKGDLIIKNAGVAGFAVEDLMTIVNIVDDIEEETKGMVSVEQLDISDSDGAVGLFVNNSDGSVIVEEFNAEILNGTALLIEDSSTVHVNDGVISSTNAPVIDASNSDLEIYLTSLSADGGDRGIRISNSTGDLFVYGEGDFGTGGTIQNVEVGFELDGFESAGLQAIDFTDNENVGIVNDVETLALWYLKITGTTEQILNATNVEALEISGSEITENDLSSEKAIELKIEEEGAYVARFMQNIVSDTPGTIFTVSNESAAPGSLSYNFSSNNIALSESQAVATVVDWHGSLQATIAGNLITGEDSSQIGFEVIANESTDLAQVTFTQNQLALDGANSTGISYYSDAPSVLSVTSNIIELGGQNGTGIQATLAKEASALISFNQIFDDAGGATAILFPSVADGSQLTIESNQIDLSQFNAFVDRGIVLSAISGDDPNVLINSTQTNTILGASTAFFLPASGWTGQLLVTE
ncbi:hypothetical protein Mal48_07160 [Thalassoglobus polymorphus]|uniref:Uncharacterized protein n=2 Tax=Thalassoglobus polymorphus TaxID=2527994 RepID=A0A517QIL1_9PLAN|nr:hypothetical protein Mal48_07160 [Thalassoglobus polymorphus]